MNHRMIRYIISMFLRAEAAFMVLPIFVCLYYKDFDEILPFVCSIAVTLAAALLLGIKKPENDAVFAREIFDDEGNFLEVSNEYLVDVETFKQVLDIYFSNSHK